MALARSSFLFAVGTFLSRITGLIRESILAGVFGANVLLDAFIIANRIPNLLRELLAEGALGASFTKVYTSLKEKSPQRADLFLFQSLQFFTFIVGVLCVLGILFAPQLVDVMTMLSKGTEHYDELVHNATGLTRILFPFIAFMTVGAIASGVLHQKGMFFRSAISSVALNLGYIVGALFFSYWMQDSAPEWLDEILANRFISGLALGVLLGGLLQTMVQFSGLPYSQFLSGSWFSIPWSEDVKKVCLLMGPMVIAGSAAQVNVLVNTNFASSLQEGAVTWLNFSFRILQLPVGIFAVGVGVVALPALTRAIAKQSTKDSLARRLEEALSLIVWLVVPCFSFLLFNSLDVIQLIFEHGEFSAADSIACSEALYAYSFALLGYGFLKVLSSYYYASDRTKFAMHVSLFSILVNLIANIFLVSRYGHVGLAYSTSCTLTMNALLLFWGLKKDLIPWDFSKLLKTGFFIALGFLCTGLVQYGTHFLKQEYALFENLHLKWDSFLTLSINGLFVVCIFAFLYFLNNAKLRSKA